MIKYKDLIDIKITENQEKFVIIDQKIIKFGYIEVMSDMKSFLSGKIIVRKSVYQRLITAQNYLKKFNPMLDLYITYGYRSPEIQTNLFIKQLRNISENQFFSNLLNLYEAVHKFIAVPTVAGHPTGGAIDLSICNVKNNKFLEFGSKIYDFSTDKCEVFNRNILIPAKKNRLLLRRIMMKAGFAPYDGEWWHFSYGDREWANYYKQSKAIYRQIPINKISF